MATTTQLIIPAAAALLGSLITGGFALIVNLRQEGQAKRRELFAVRRAIYADAWRTLRMMREGYEHRRDSDFEEIITAAGEFVEQYVRLPWWKRRKPSVALAADEWLLRAERLQSEAEDHKVKAANLEEITRSASFAELNFFASDAVRSAIAGVLADMHADDETFTEAMSNFRDAVRHELNLR